MAAGSIRWLGHNIAKLLLVCCSLTVTDKSYDDKWPKPTTEKQPGSKSAVWKCPMQCIGIHETSKPRRQD